jgi:hypothetical protein
MKQSKVVGKVVGKVQGPLVAIVGDRCLVRARKKGPYRPATEMPDFRRRAAVGVVRLRGWPAWRVTSAAMWETLLLSLLEMKKGKADRQHHRGALL